MKKSFREIIRSAAFRAVSCVALAAALAATLAGCKANLAQNILDAIEPPAHQLKLFYLDNAYAEDSVVTMQKTYTPTGEAETFTLTNTSGIDVDLVNVSVSDKDHFTVAGLPASPSTISSAKSATFSVTYVSTADGSNQATLTIVYKAAGKTRSFSVAIKATRTTDVSEVSIIEVRDDGNGVMASNGPTPFDFGYASGPIDKVFTVKNIGAKDLVITDAISSNSTDFTILTSPVGTIASGASSVIKVRRLDGRVGSTATISIVSNASNTSIFKLNVSSKNFESGSITVLDGASPMTSGSSFDMGYSAGSAITKTFTIKNTGVGDLMVYSVSSSNSSGISVTSKPSTNSTLAEGASANFVLSIPAASAATTAVITITTSDSATTAFSLNVAGGGATNSLSHSGAVTYKLKTYGYDFGYASGATTKNITLTNSGAFPVTLTGNTMASPAFAVSSMPGTIASGDSATLSVTYTPVSATTWSDSTCTLTDSAGRSYQIYFSGSGFKQPSNVSSTPALWLRADRIGPSDLMTVDLAYKVSTWQDASGHGLVANAETYNSNKLRPTYNPSNASMNGFPSIAFSGTAYTDVLSVSSSAGFVKMATGTTTFVAFRTSNSVDGNRYILQCFYQTNNTTEVFPRLMWEARYIDTGDGLYASALPTAMTPAIPVGSTSSPLIAYMMGTYGNTNSAPRYFCDSDWNNPSLVAAKTYVAALQYTSTTAATKATPNMWAWLNNYPDNATTLKNKTLGYLYSTNNSPTSIGPGVNTNYSPATTTNYYFGAYGLPVGTGTGMINPSAPANDFASYLQGVPPYSSTPGTTTNHPYFYNWLDPTYNTTIRVMYIGGTSGWAGNFMGDIAEIIMFDVPLSATDVATVSSYLMTKYGVTARMTP